MDKRIKEIYINHENMPYISPDRNIDEWFLNPKQYLKEI